MWKNCSGWKGFKVLCHFKIIGVTNGDGDGEGNNLGICFDCVHTPLSASLGSAYTGGHGKTRNTVGDFNRYRQLQQCDNNSHQPSGLYVKRSRTEKSSEP